MLDLLNIPKEQRKYIRSEEQDIIYKKPNKSLKYFLRTPEYQNYKEKEINTKQLQTPAQFFLNPVNPVKPVTPVKISSQIQQNNILYKNWHLFNQNKIMQYQLYNEKEKLSFFISEFIKINDKIKNINHLFNKKLKELNIQVGGSNIFSDILEYINDIETRADNLKKDLSSTLTVAESLNVFVKQLDASNKTNEKKAKQLNERYIYTNKYLQELNVENESLKHSISTLKDLITQITKEYPFVLEFIKNKI